MIAPLGRWCDQLAERLGQVAAGALVLAARAVDGFDVASALDGAW